MHEVSICQGIIQAIETEVQPEELGHVREVHLRVGVLSGIEPLFLKQVYGMMVQDSALRFSALVCDTVHAAARCGPCGRDFAVSGSIFICPHCGSPSGEVTAGQELMIYRIILETPIYEKTDQ